MIDQTADESTSKHTIGDAGYGPAASSAIVEVEVCFSRVSCPACGIPFQIPTEFKLAKQSETASVICPNGHSVPLAKPAPENLATMLDASVLLGKLAEARNENAMLRARPLVEKENLIIDKKEMLRRCNLLAARATRTDCGRKICAFCGKEFSSASTNFRNHLRDKHRDEIELMQPIELK